MAWVKILILAQAMSAGSGCYGALERRNSLKALSGAITWEKIPIPKEGFDGAQPACSFLSAIKRSSLSHVEGGA